MRQIVCLIHLTYDLDGDMTKDNDMFDFSYYQTDQKLYKMNIIGKDEHGKTVINNSEVPGKFKEYSSSNVYKNSCM